MFLEPSIGQEIALGDLGSLQIKDVKEGRVLLALNLPGSTLAVRKECWEEQGRPEWPWITTPGRLQPEMDRTREAQTMLRGVNQGVVINSDICVTVVSINCRTIRLSVVAPEGTEVLLKED